MKKEKNKIAGLVIAFFALFAFTSTVKAQCFNITNQLSCTIGIHVRIYDCSTAACNVYTTTVAPGANIPLSCTGCTTRCDAEVNVLSVGGTPVSGMSAFFSGTCPGATVSVPPCGGGPSTASICWNGTTFMVQ